MLTINFGFGITAPFGSFKDHFGPNGAVFGIRVRFKNFFGTCSHRLTNFILEVWLYLTSLKLSRVGGWGGGWGWLENLILMKTQSSALTWTWTLDFDLGFVNSKLQ